MSAGVQSDRWDGENTSWAVAACTAGGKDSALIAALARGFALLVP